MLSRLRDTLQEYAPKHPVTLLEADICQLDYQPSSFIALNYCLQFIPSCQRLALLSRLHHNLVPNGALVLFEKFHNESPQQADLDGFHQTFKQQQGYSTLAISQKRQALENVLQTDTLTTHQTRLAEAGFVRITRLFQCLNFAGWIAYKSGPDV